MIQKIRKLFDFIIRMLERCRNILEDFNMSCDEVFIILSFLEKLNSDLKNI